jgi:hypothetical protein
MKCSHPECTGNHSGKWRIGEMCPVAQEKRRASWRAYDQHLYEEHQASYVAMFGSLSSTIPVNKDVRLDLRYMKRCFYKYKWQLEKRIADADERMDALLEC